MLKISAFTASATLLIGRSTIHSLTSLSIDQNIDSWDILFFKKRLLKNSLFDYWWNINGGMYHVDRNTYQITKVKIFTI